MQIYLHQCTFNGGMRSGCNTRLRRARPLSSTSGNDTNRRDMGWEMSLDARAQALKNIAARLQQDAGFTKRNLRIHSREHAIVTHGMDSVHWRDLRGIQVTSFYVSQTLYRLKCKPFPTLEPIDKQNVMSEFRLLPTGLCPCKLCVLVLSTSPATRADPFRRLG